MKTILLALLMSLTLIGCSLCPTKEVIIEKVTIVKQKVPDDLLVECKPTSLIDKQNYLTSDLYVREKFLTYYILDLASVISKCNNQLLGIRRLNNASKQKDK